MKVPHNILGRTRPTSAGMDPLRVNVDPDAFGAGIARGLSDLSQGIGAAFARVEERDSKTNRFAAMTNYSDFETSINGKLAELKKNADPAGQGFTKSASEMYEVEAANFLDKMVAPEVRDEARYWLSNTKQRIIGDSMNFQYEAGNAFFRAGVDKEYQNSLKGLDPALGGDPAQLPAMKEKMKAYIDATDLSEIEKAELFRTTSVGLEGVVYKQAVKTEIQVGGGGVKGLIRKEEGFRTTPYWDVNAWRIGYGSDTITRADGSVAKVVPGMTITKEDAERDLDRRVNTEFMPRAAQQIGPQAWGALRGSAKAALASVAYNYGSLPNSVVNAAKTGDLGQLASAVENLSSNKDRRKREAAMIRSNTEVSGELNIDDSALFANVPYEDRLSLRKDAEAEYSRDLAAQAEAEKFRINTMTNDLLNKINDGLAGQTEIDAARADWLTDYDTIKKAQDLFEKKNGEVNLVNDTLGRLATGATFDPTSEDDRKGLNAVVGKGGLSRIDAMDQAYFSNGIIPLVTQAQDIPTDVAGLLQGMVRSNNQAKGLWAFDALALLQDQAPEAFNNRIPDALAADVNFYRQRRTSLPADEMFEAINGGRTQAERQGRALLYQEAQDNLKTKKEGVAQISTLVQDVVSGYDGWTASAEQIGAPAFAKQLTFDYEAAYTDYYVNRDPNHERAAEWATKQIQRDWAVSEGGGGILMKNPPELVGYPKVMGSYDWIGEQAKELLQLGPEDRYQLISDDKTASELVKFRQGLGPAPSYQVVTFDASGTPRLRMFSRTDGPKGEEVTVETSNPARIRFEKTPAHREMESIDFDVQQIDNQLRELDSELGIHLRTRTPPPLEMIQEREELMQKRNGIVEDRATRFPAAKPIPLPPEEQPWQGLSPEGFIPGAQ